MVENLRDAFELLGIDWILWLLAALSLWSVAIMVERWLFFRRHHAEIGAVERLVRSAIGDIGGDSSGDDAQTATNRLRELPGMEATVITEALSHRHLGAQGVQEIIAGAIARERLKHDRHLTVLGTLGNNAPFIGLFGTVIAIVSAFHELEVGFAKGSTETRNEMIMGSISEALVATAVGLLVAIPAVIAFNYFKAQIRKRSATTEALARLVLAHTGAPGGGETPSPRAGKQP